MIKQIYSIVKIALFSILIFILHSCEEDFGEVIDNDASGKYQNGLFIVNEGLFSQGSGSLSFYSTEFSEMENDIFYFVNERPLGDVPQSIYMHDTLGYVVVNNSGKIEIISLNSAKSYGSILGLNSPRYLLPVSEDKAYVSSLYSDSLTVIDLNTNTIISYINISCSSEQMKKVGDKLYAANWSRLAAPSTENNKIAIVDIQHDSFDSYITVGIEPNSMVVDKNNNLWVLCSGGYDNVEKPCLMVINTSDNTVIKQIKFSKKNMSPTSLCINGAGDKLYFLNQDVFSLSINDTEIPSSPFLANDGHLFYSLGIDPQNEDVYISDAMDYQQNGEVFRYNKYGVFLDSERAGIIPGNFAFRTK